MQDLEEWAQLLLLDALQRSGFFIQSSNAMSLAELQSRVPTGYARFMAEATAMLEISGKQGCNECPSVNGEILYMHLCLQLCRHCLMAGPLSVMRAEIRLHRL